VLIDGRLEDVWREITRTDDVQAAFFNGKLVAANFAPGTKVGMTTKSGKYTSWIGEVLVFEPMKRYGHTFRFTNHDDPPVNVLYELEVVETNAGGRVKFTMTLTELPPGTKTTKQMSQGGTWILENLKSVIERGRATGLARFVYWIFAVLEGTSPKRCRSENWPLVGKRSRS
jgi:hypothetical protein